jgi:hypothetical protein
VWPDDNQNLSSSKGDLRRIVNIKMPLKGACRKYESRFILCPSDISNRLHLPHPFRLVVLFISSSSSSYHHHRRRRRRCLLAYFGVLQRSSALEQHFYFMMLTRCMVSDGEDSQLK